VDCRIVGQAGGRSDSHSGGCSGSRAELRRAGGCFGLCVHAVNLAVIQEVIWSLRKSVGSACVCLGSESVGCSSSSAVVQAVRRSFKHFGCRSSSSAVVLAVMRSFKQFGGRPGSSAVVQAVRRPVGECLGSQSGGGSCSRAGG